MRLAFLAAITAVIAIAQPQPLRFDVTSVKLQKWTLPATVGLKFEGNTFHAEHMQLGDLILFAYNLKGHFQVFGLPDWAKFGTVMDAAGFQIDAKAVPGQNPTEDEFRQMLQALLADRFHLQIHHENREIPVYNLTIGKGGSKLRETAGGKTGIQQHKAGQVGMRENATNVTIPYAIEAGLAFYSGRPMLDKTGLTGI